MNDIYLSVVIPTYNEEKKIIDTLSALKSFFKSKPYKFEIIISDDGSRDSTVVKVKEAIQRDDNIKLFQEIHKGKGAAVKKGILAAQGKIIFYMDADLSTPLQEVDKFLDCLGDNYDIVIGSRALPASKIKIHQPWWREGLGRLFNWFVQQLLLKGIKDSQCGFKIFKRDVALDLFKRQKLNGFSFDVEILYLARKRGYIVKEIPVKWFNSPDSKVNVLKELLGVFFDLFRIKFIHAGKL